eukprot:3709072-Prymnesium_polylepis.1
MWSHVHERPTHMWSHVTQDTPSSPPTPPGPASVTRCTRPTGRSRTAHLETSTSDTSYSSSQSSPHNAPVVVEHERRLDAICQGGDLLRAGCQRCSSPEPRRYIRYSVSGYSSDSA